MPLVTLTCTRGKPRVHLSCVVLLQAVIACPGPVTDLVESHDKRFLFVACACRVYRVSSQLLESRYEPSSRRWRDEFLSIAF